MHDEHGGGYDCGPDRRRFFSGSHEKSCAFLKEHGYLLDMLLKSQFSRRLGGIPESVWRGLMSRLAAPFHESDSLKIYLSDSFPVPVCRNIRMPRCKIYKDECFRGRVSSRKEYFYGLKVHALMTESGIPVEIFMSPASYCRCKFSLRLFFSCSCRKCDLWR